MTILLSILAFFLMIACAEARQKTITIEHFNFTGSPPDFSVVYGVNKHHAFNRTSLGQTAAYWTDTNELPNDTRWYDESAAALTGSGGGTHDWCRSGELITFDHEIWRVEAADGSAARQATAHKWFVMGTELKARLPNCLLTFYGYNGSNGVKDDFTRGTSAVGSGNYTFWQSMNNDLAEIWQAPWDVIAPTFYYSFTRAVDGPDNVVLYNTWYNALMDEYIRMRTTYGHGQQIRPYIWHKHRAHPGDLTVTGFLLDTDVWNAAVCTAYRRGDGIMWFTVTNTVWSDTIEWWIHFKQILQDPNPCGNFESTRSPRSFVP